MQAALQYQSVTRPQLYLEPGDGVTFHRVPERQKLLPLQQRKVEQSSNLLQC